MKKIIALLTAFVMCLSLCACGGNVSSKTTSPETTEETPITKLNLGETAATDLVEFTLESSQFTYYVSGISTNFCEPVEGGSVYAASLGHCYVSVTCTLTSKDRGGSISFPNNMGWNPGWIVSYQGKEYKLKGYDLNNVDGSRSLSLSDSAIIDKETGKVIERYSLSKYLLRAGETVTIRTFGIIDVEPENLTDGYDFTVNVLNSKGEYESFTYTVPAR